MKHHTHRIIGMFPGFQHLVVSTVKFVESKYLQTTFHFCPMLAQLSQNQNVPMKHFHTDMLQCVAGCFHEFGKLRGKEQNHGNKYKGKTASARSVDGKQKN